jgi:branched-chain amino acid transport system substrate-binding protein
MKNIREIFLEYNPGEKPPPTIYQLGWYWGMIISEGLRRAGKDINGEKLIDAVETLKDFDTGGLCGPVTYTPESHKATDYCKIFKADVKKKRLVAVTDWVKPPKRK